MKLLIGLVGWAVTASSRLAFVAFLLVGIGICEIAERVETERKKRREAREADAKALERAFGPVKVAK